MQFRLSALEKLIVLGSSMAAMASLVDIVHESRRGVHVVPGGLVVVFAALTIWFVCRAAWVRTSGSNVR